MANSPLENDPELVKSLLEESCRDLTDSTKWEFRLGDFAEDGVTIQFRPKPNIEGDEADKADKEY